MKLVTPVVFACSITDTSVFRTGKESANSFSVSNNGPVSFKLISPCGQPVVSVNALSPETYITVRSWACQRMPHLRGSCMSPVC